MSIDKFDVLVVGAGPSGSSAAIAAQEYGMRTLLIDSCDFPRAKVCGDLLGPDSIRELVRMKVPVPPVHPIRQVRFYDSTDRERAHTLIVGDHADKAGGVIERSRLDTHLLSAATARGCRFSVGSFASARRGAFGGWRVYIERRDRSVSIVECGTIIWAAGSRRLPQDLLLHACGEAESDRRFIAARTYAVSSRPVDHTLEVYVGVNGRRGVLPGYSWCAPTGGSYRNIGLGVMLSRRGEPIEIRDTLRRFLDSLEDIVQFDALQIATIPIGPRRLGGDDFLVVGDAAALAYPFSGEGVQSALVSGAMAASSIAKLGKASQQEYQEEH